MRPTFSVRPIFRFAAAALIAGPLPAAACMMKAPFQIEDIAQADAIFTGRLIRYELVSPGRANSLDEYGLLTVRVDKVLKGKVSGDVQLYWWNSTFGVPKTLPFDGPIIVAASGVERTGLPLRGPSATVFPSRRPDLLQVLQAPCSSPFILPYVAKSEDNIRAVLRGETVAPFNYIRPPAVSRGVE